MRIKTRIAILLVPLLFSGWVAAEQTLSAREQYISYPFMERAWKAAERENWPETESLAGYLLNRIPAHQEARALLAQALGHQGRYAEALREAEQLIDVVAAEQVQHELRMRWISQQDPGAEQVTRWLLASGTENREALWQSYSMALQQRLGSQAALDWLAATPLPSSPTLARWRAVLAELSNDNGQVISNLQPLMGRDELTTEDRWRLGLAYLAEANKRGIKRLIAVAPASAEAVELRRLAGYHEIAASRPEQALLWLSPLETHPLATSADLQTLWELGRQTNKIGLVRRLAAALDRPCLETAEWLQMHAPQQQALDQLASCSADIDPQRWLVLARRLRATDLIQQQTLPGEWELTRRRLVVDLGRENGQERPLLLWLDTQPEDALTLRSRAELLQHLNDPRAAQAWLTFYRSHSDVRALDQASYLLSQQGDNEQALTLLLSAFRQRPDDLSATSLSRLSALLASSDQEYNENLMASLLERLPVTERDELLLSMAGRGHCGWIQQQLSTEPYSANDYVALARCAATEQPGMAAIYYRKSIDAGAAGQQTALAFVLQAAGDPAAALAIWLQQEPSELTDTDLLAAAQTAYDAKQPSTADSFWRQLEPDSKKLGANEGAYMRLGAAIALAQGQSQLALERERRALSAQPEASFYYAAASTAMAAGEPELNLEWLRKSVSLAPTNTRYQLDYALRLASADTAAQRRLAIPYLEAARRDYPSNSLLAEALGLRLAEQGQDRAAAAQLRDAIDLQQGALLTADQSVGELSESEAARRYGMRRSHQTQERRDSFTLASTWSPYNVSGSAGQPVGGENYQIAMWDHVLEDSQGNARKVAVYGRVLTSGQAQENYFDAAGVGVGVRMKPLRESNINMYVEVYDERQLNGGSDRGTDLLLRATASFLDQGEYRSDWRVGRDNWSERSLYVDAAWFLRETERQLLVRYQQGHSAKLNLPGAQTLTPYGFLQGMAQERRQDLRMGVGLRWQLWHGDDRYSAWRGRLTVRSEYQFGVAGRLYNQENGFLTSVEWNW